LQEPAGRTTTVYIFSGTKVIAEYENGAAPTAPTREYIYSGGALLAKIESGSTTYYHPDQLSVRLMTDSSGNVIGQQAHYPFGESWYQNNTTTKWMFTTYERDADSGNDYAMARYDINRLGRFASPDLLAGSVSDPQTLDRYPYVRNDPVNLVDPLGPVSEEACHAQSANWPSCLWSGDLYYDTWGYCAPWYESCGGGVGGSSDSFYCVTVLEGGVEGNFTPATYCVETIGLGASSQGPPDQGHGGGGGPIANALKKLGKLLKLDKECAGFLDSKKGDVLGDIGTLLQFGAFGATAIPPTQNPDGTTTVVNAASGGYIQGQAITVNTNGAFFNSTFNGAPLTEDRGRIRGGTDAAQGFILLHEMGHIEDVLVPDAGNQKLVDQNNKSLEKNRKKTIDALRGGGGD
jgi:RHS repeat-associated protein